MKKQRIIIFLSLIFGCFFLFNFCLAAESQPSNDEISAVASPANCFDYYKFQSVQISLGATEKDVYEPGEEIVFSGEIQNQNDYPIVDGYVFARIGKKNPNYTQEGNLTIDEIIPLKNINLDSGGSKQVQFKWTVPDEISQGDYRIDFFFSVGKKFVLGGLPFTNEVVAGGTEFKINSGDEDYISFDKSKTQINGQKYNHIGNWPEIKPNEEVSVVQPIKNTFSRSEKMKVIYDLYYWDSLDEKDKISSKEEEVEISANGETVLNYTVPAMKDTVNYLKITAVSNTQKSIVNIRFFSRQEHVKLNFPAMTKFPLKENQGLTLFSCFHNTSGINTSGKVAISIFDKDNNLVDKTEYDGSISGAMMAVKKDINPQKNYDWLKLSAVVTDKNGNIDDQYEAIYDCQKINPETCLEKFGEAGSSGSSLKNRMIVLVAVLFLLSLLIIVIKKRKNSTIFRLIALALVSSSLWIFQGIDQKAWGYNEQTATVSTSYNHDFAVYDDDSGLGCGGCNLACIGDYHRLYIGAGASITHRVGMTTGNYTVGSGEAINFNYSPDDPYFYSTGYSWTTPYGRWVSDLSCKNDFPWYSNDSVRGFPYTFHTYVAAIKPNVYMTSSNPGVVSCSGMNCTAVSPGTATLYANIGTTYGKSFLGYYNGSPFCSKKYSCAADNYHVGLAFSSASMAWNVTVTSPVPIVSISASPNPIDCGASSKLIWTSKNADSCWGSNSANDPNDWGGAFGSPVALNGSAVTVPLNDNRTYSIKCKNSYGEQSSSVIVRLKNPLKNVSISADPNPIDCGTVTELTWGSKNAEWCWGWNSDEAGNTDPNDWGGSGEWVDPKGKQPTALLFNNRTYHLKCGKCSSEQYSEIKVKVKKTCPSVTITANPNPIEKGQSTTLTWDPQNVDWCWGWNSANDEADWHGWKKTDPLRLSESTKVLDEDRTYYIECGFGETAEKVFNNVTVKVNSSTLPVVNVYSNPPSVYTGQSSTVYWNVTNADKCQAIAGDWDKSVPNYPWKSNTGGSESTGVLNSERKYTYTLECENETGKSQGTGEVTVTKKPSPPPCTPNCSDDENYCEGEEYPSNCPGETCVGTKNCTGWIEIAP